VGEVGVVDDVGVGVGVGSGVGGGVQLGLSTVTMMVLSVSSAQTGAGELAPRANKIPNPIITPNPSQRVKEVELVLLPSRLGLLLGGGVPPS
jgi:hypothetical protein